MLQSFLLVFIGLLPIVNPPGSALLVLAMTRRASRSQRAVLARQVATYAFFIMIASLFIGAYVLQFFGISVPVMRVAGGLVLALSGSFAALAMTSAITRLLVYAGTCASVLALRRQGPAPFTVPLGPVVPLLALALSVAILYGASRGQLQMGAFALAIGAALYIGARVSRRGE